MFVMCDEVAVDSSSIVRIWMRKAVQQICWLRAHALVEWCGRLGATHFLRSTRMTADTRIESLETQVRTLKRMLVGVFGVVVVGVLLAATTLQTVPDVIRAKKFEVVNDEGKVLAGLGQGTYGSFLTLRNRSEEVFALLYTDGDGSVLSIYNKDGKRGAAILANANGGVVNVANKEGKSVAVVAANADGGVLSIDNTEGKPVVEISANAIGMGRLIVRNTDGKPVAALFAGSDGMGRLSVRNKDGNPVALLSANADGDGEMKTTDGKGTMTSHTP